MQILRSTNSVLFQTRDITGDDKVRTFDELLSLFPRFGLEPAEGRDLCSFIFHHGKQAKIRRILNSYYPKATVAQFIKGDMLTNLPGGRRVISVGRDKRNRFLTSTENVGSFMKWAREDWWLANVKEI